MMKTPVQTSRKPDTFLTPDSKAPVEFRSPGFYQTAVQVDVLRANREEERTELQELNQRLEMYILHNRGNEAGETTWKNEMNTLLEKLKRDLKKVEASRDKGMSQMRDVYEKQLELYNKLKVDYDVLYSNHKNLTSDHKSLQNYSNELQHHNEVLSKELSDTKAALLASVSEARNALHDLEHERIRHSQLRNEYNNLIKKLDDNNDLLVKNDTIIAQLRDKVIILETTSKSEINRLRDSLRDAIERADSTTNAVRVDYENRMKDIFEEQYKNARNDKAEALAAINEEYQDKILGYRASLEKMGHDLEIERNKANAITNDLNAVLHENAELRNYNDVLDGKIKELNTVIERMRDGESELINEKNEIIRNIKQAFKQKDQEFDALMDLKIALALELQTYESLVHAEECRLGISTKKRRLGDDEDDVASGTKVVHLDHSYIPNSPFPFSILPLPSQKKSTSTTSTISSTTLNTSSSLLISGKDAHSDYVAVRNGSTENVNLQGWMLITGAKKVKFYFPEGAVLLPNDTFTLRTGEKMKGEWPQTVWVSQGCWNDKGDTCTLLDPTGQEVAQVEIRPNEQVEKEKTNDCVIM